MSTFATQPIQKNAPFAPKPTPPRPAPAGVAPASPLSGLGAGPGVRSEDAAQVFTGMYDGPQKQPEHRGKGGGDEEGGMCDDLGSVAGDISGSLDPLIEWIEGRGQNAGAVRAVRDQLGLLNTGCAVADAVQQVMEARDAFAHAAQVDSAVARCDAYQAALQALSSCAGLLGLDQLASGASAAADVVGGFRLYAAYLDMGINQTGIECFGGAADANGNPIRPPASCTSNND